METAGPGSGLTRELFGAKGEGLGYHVRPTSDIILSYELWACLALYQVGTT